ncbi:NAD(P)H-binding protein [Streptomyces sp. NPDC059002]|uniref:NAD(P)H-binding protein n=1 Tax=Streptomyces sp. NPDC059002 TaxID=3346690 RepID=UPI0036B42FFB
MTILVTGATGTVGREVVRRIDGRLPVRILARTPRRVDGAGPSAEIVEGDYADPDSLARALRGVRTAFVVTNDVGGDDDARFVRAAAAAGVRHLVKLSAAAVEDPCADDLITRWQRGNEDLIRDSGLDWTFLRPRSFMSNSLGWASSIRAEGVVRGLYGASANACVDPRDIAEVALRALTEDGHAGRSYILTGPGAISAVDQTAELSRVLGVPLAFVELTPSEQRERYLARYPEPLAEALMQSARRQGDGAKARVTPVVEEVTGRPARPFADWAADHAAAFAVPARTSGG